MTPEEEDLFGRIEAEQTMIRAFIDDSKRLCARSDVLLNAARDKPKSKEPVIKPQKAD